MAPATRLGSRQWMTARRGKQGGSVASTAKADSARTNGRRGGRLKKSSVT